MNGAIYALRLKLSDFLNDPLEHLVVEKIHEIYKVHTFKLQLWYDEGEVKPADLKSLILKLQHTDGISIRKQIRIKQTSYYYTSNFILNNLMFQWIELK